MSLYNLSFVDSVNNTADIVKGTNDLTGGLFLALFLMAIYLIIIMRSMRSDGDFPATFTVASFFLAILSGMGFWAGLMAQWMVIYPIVLLLISLLVFIWHK